MREIKFRAWDTLNKKFISQSITIDLEVTIRFDGVFVSDDLSIDGTESGDRIILSQFTGLLDKNGKEIYELMELNNKWKVSYKAPKYILIDISTGDIIDFNEQNKYEITREYTDIPKDPKGSVD